mmetsp:Transcript_10202/g.23618  ORF Transcript_10202/g.23618 Transcript_10202/m.23618 type:complete len:429 (+) Transcript_10202:364-1650(+)
MQLPIVELYQRYLIQRNVTIDSRRVPPKAIFFALKGPCSDGHIFAQQALDHGASYAVIEDARYKQDERYLLVENVLDTLQALAAYHRKQLEIPIIGITGSSGKTTTKELIHAVLCRRYVTIATQGNLNNHIGVPLTILDMDAQTEIGVVEMGASHVGEIAQLCVIARPTHGLITNIDHVHIEGFGSLEGVIKGKRELYDYLLQNNGVVLVNTTNAILRRITQFFPRVITYPQSQDFYSCRLVKEDPFLVYQGENAQVVRSQLLGRYHLDNIAAALCVAKFFHIDEIDANRAIQNYQPNSNRSQIIHKGTNTIFLDAYNANLTSTKGAIRTFHLMSAVSRVLILGDMAELGTESKEAHRALVHFTMQGNYEAILLCGPRMGTARQHNPKAWHFSKKKLVKYLAKKKFSNTVFLIKGSRFLQLETLIPFI